MTIFVSMEPPGPTPPGTHVSSCLTPVGSDTTTHYHTPMGSRHHNLTP